MKNFNSYNHKKMENCCCQNCKVSFEDPHNNLNYCLECDIITCHPCFQDIHLSGLMKLHGEPMDISKKPKKCEKHKSMKMDLVCTDCRIFLCPMCAVMEHSCPREKIIEKSSFYELARKTVTELTPKLKELQKSFEDFHEEAANNVKMTLAFNDSIDDEIEKVLSNERQNMKREAEEYYTKELQKYTRIENSASGYNNKNLKLITDNNEEFPLDFVNDFTMAIPTLTQGLLELKRDSSTPQPFKFSLEDKKKGVLRLTMHIFHEAENMFLKGPNEDLILGESFFGGSNEVSTFFMSACHSEFYYLTNTWGDISKHIVKGESWIADSASSLNDYTGTIHQCKKGVFPDSSMRLLMFTPDGDQIKIDTTKKELFLFAKGNHESGRSLSISTENELSFVLVGDRRQHLMAYSKRTYRIYREYIRVCRGLHKVADIFGSWDGPDIVSCYNNYILFFNNTTRILRVMEISGMKNERFEFIDSNSSNIHGDLISMKTDTISRMIYCIFKDNTSDTRYIYKGTVPSLLN